MRARTSRHWNAARIARLCAGALVIVACLFVLRRQLAAAAESPAPKGPQPVAPASEWSAPEASIGELEASPGTAAGDPRAEIERAAAARLAAGDGAAAAALYAQLLTQELAGQDADRTALARWSAALIEAQRAHRWNPKGAWPAFEMKVEKGDTLTHIARRAAAAHPELALDASFLQRVNGLKTDRELRIGQVLRVPLDRPSAQVHVGARWLLYFLGDEIAWAADVAVGRDGHETITGEFVLGPKDAHPAWTREDGVVVQPDDPEYPLGSRWLPWFRAGRPTSFAFHGTNDEPSVGSRASQGCVRLRNADVELLFEILPQGARIRSLP